MLLMNLYEDNWLCVLEKLRTMLSVRNFLRMTLVLLFWDVAELGVTLIKKWHFIPKLWPYCGIKMQELSFMLLLKHCLLPGWWGLNSFRDLHESFMVIEINPACQKLHLTSPLNKTARCWKHFVLCCITRRKIRLMATILHVLWHFLHSSAKDMESFLLPSVSVLKHCWTSSQSFDIMLHHQRPLIIQSYSPDGAIGHPILYIVLGLTRVCPLHEQHLDQFIHFCRAVHVPTHRCRQWNAQ